MDALLSMMLVEWVWSVVSFIGLLTTAWLLREAIRDRETLRASGRNGPSARLANGLIRTELLRTVQLFIMMGLGVAALVTPDPDDTLAFNFRIIAAWTITFIAILTTTNAVLDRKMRHDVDMAIEKVYTEGGTYRE